MVRSPEPETDADIPLPDEGEPRDSQSEDSRILDDEGSDAEGEDLMEDANRCSDCQKKLCHKRPVKEVLGMLFACISA